MCDELREGDIESLPLPKDWAESVRHAVLNIVGIVRLAMLSGRELLIQEGDVRQAQIHRLETEVALLREELRIVAARMNRIDPQRRLSLLIIPSSFAVKDLRYLLCIWRLARIADFDGERGRENGQSYWDASG
jgi:hypothetical protein